MPASTRILSIVVRCKACNLNIPSGVDEQPSQAIAVRCPACKNARYYLPSEIFVGAPSYEVSKVLRGR
jgi:hypothetical protein